MNTKRRKERGAIVVEASISLTTFVFALYMIISLVDVAFVQYKMAVALNSATKEISQYVYLYYKFGLDGYNKALSEGAEESHATASNAIETTENFMDGLITASGDINAGNFQTAFDTLKNTGNAAADDVKNLVNEIKSDPKSFIMGMGNLAASELTEEAKNLLGQVLAEAFMQKNLRTVAKQEADTFLKRHKVQNGMDGLDFAYTTMMAYGTSNEINMVCSYEVKVVELLRHPITFKFRQMSKALAWGNGISSINPPSIWDTLPPMARGKYIVAQEKKSYSYTGVNQGFDAYDKSKNEFITITTIDPQYKTYQDVKGIKGRLNTEFNNLRAATSNLDESITVTNRWGVQVPLTSKKDTRAYRLVVLLPEDASEADKQNLNTAISEFKAANPGYKIEVEVKQGYGTAKPPESASIEIRPKAVKVALSEIGDSKAEWLHAA